MTCQKSGTFLRGKHLFVDCLMNLNAAMQAPMLLQVLGGRLRHKLQKTLKKCIGFLSNIESTSDKESLKRC